MGTVYTNIDAGLIRGPQESATERREAVIAQAATALFASYGLPRPTITDAEAKERAALAMELARLASAAVRR